LLGDASTWSGALDPRQLSDEYEALNARLEELYAEWAELAELAGVS
jgi:hypothetical protein